MNYISTRGGMKPAPFLEILLEGLASDGGLAVPEAYPRIDAATLTAWRSLSYAELAFEIIRLFVNDLPEATLREIVARTYTREVFGSDAITPVARIGEGLYLLELSNGPTLAFKDLAMQFLGNLLEEVLATQARSLNILGATSGDTGSAAEHAMKGKKNVRVFMLSPFGKMSPFQAAQMYSLGDANIFNIAIRGVFDDAQDLVKAVSHDADFKSRHQIGTVNSINWARVVAQVVYYFKGYFSVTSANTERVSFTVPSGNFGNIYAGHIARTMGLPIARLVCATNENDVLDEFFRSGCYRVRPPSETLQTSSPSMDISKASNFERFIYDLFEGDASAVRSLWRQIDEQGRFDLAGTPQFGRIDAHHGLVSGSSTHAKRVEAIRVLEAATSRVIDPHTADGVAVASQYRDAGVPMIVLETAQPAKFAATIVEALGREPDRPARFAGIESLTQHLEVMDVDLPALKSYIALHGG